MDWREREKRLAVSLAPSSDLSPPFLPLIPPYWNPTFEIGFSQTLSETAISVPHSAAVLQAWPLCGPKLGSRNAPHGACRLIASLAPDWAKARFSRCTPWCPHLILVVSDGGWVKKTTRLPRYTMDHVVGVWSEALGDLQERSPAAGFALRPLSRLLIVNVNVY